MIKNRSILTASAFTAMFFLGVGTAVIGAASSNIGLSPSQTGYMVSIQNVGFMLSVVAVGALADTRDKAKLLAIASLVVAAGFFFYYYREPFFLNLLVMLVIGIGIGGYEGATDPMLVAIHQKRQSLFITINHLFVTLGALLITVYLIFLQFDWRASMVQSAVLVLLLAVVLGFSTVPPSAKAAGESLKQRMGFLRTQKPLLVLFLLVVLVVGIELSLIGLLTSFLIDLRGFDQFTSKFGLVAYLLGGAVGRLVMGIFSRDDLTLRYILALFLLTAGSLVVLLFAPLPPAGVYALLFLCGITISVILPLVISLTGMRYPEMPGTAMGIIKLGIPVGGIVLPLLISLVTDAATFQASLALLPVFALLGFGLTYFNKQHLAAR